MVTQVRKPRPPVPNAPAPPQTPAFARPPCRVLLIEARFYEAIADELARGAIEELEAQNASFDRIQVPGALEIPQALAQAVRAGLIPSSAAYGRYAGAVALGCVIRGETSHYDMVCENANHWLMQIAITHAVPVGNAILTVETEQQALARAKGGRESSKGAEAVRACLKLVDAVRVFEGQSV